MADGSTLGGERQDTAWGLLRRLRVELAQALARAEAAERLAVEATKGRIAADDALVEAQNALHEARGRADDAIRLLKETAR